MKVTLILLFAFLPAILGAGDIVYTKNPDGTVTKQEVIEKVNVSSVADQIARDISFINEQIADYTARIAKLEAAKADKQKELMSILASK